MRSFYLFIVNLIFILTVNGQIIFYPGSSGCDGASKMTFELTEDIASNTIHLKGNKMNYSDGSFESIIFDINLTPISKNVYCDGNAMERNENRFIVKHPDGTYIYVKAEQQLDRFNCSVPLTKEKPIGDEYSMPNRMTYCNYGTAEVNKAYENGKGIWAAEKAKRITPLINNLHTIDDNTFSSQAQMAHTKLFASPDFKIKGLSVLKILNIDSDWEIIRDEYYDNKILYRTRGVVVIAKQSSTGKCFAMYNSITQDYIGGWSTARCSYYDERASAMIELGDKDGLIWGEAVEIFCK